MNHIHRRASLPVLGLSIVLAMASSQPVHGAANDLLDDALNFSGATLHLRPYVQMPNGFDNIISMTTRPGDTRLYVTTQQGTIFAIDDDGNGNTTPTAWFNLASAVQTATGRTIFGSDGHDGLQSVAFHPDFEDSAADGYGKLYTTYMENPPPSTAGHHYLGSTSGSGPESVLVEWTYDHNTQQVLANSYRELFRAKLPVQDHKIKQARFNLYAEPGDEDYGLLYLTHGDSSSQQSTEDRPLLLDNVFGKMMRIDPLESGADPYSIPTTNPFYNDANPDVLQEIYAYGFRNPHNFSFNPDDEGNVHILVGDIGRSNIEEVNLVVNGGDYGWTKREGTFEHLQGTDYNPPGENAGYIWGVADLDEFDEVTDGVDAQGNNYIYPVAQWDHNDDDVNEGDDYTATAIASGFVIRNGSDPDLDNQFIHNNFAFNHGDVYHNDFDEILNAVTQLDDNDSSRDQVSELTESEVFRLHLALDHDSNPNTAEQTNDDLNALLGTFRNDARFGEGLFGEMYISTKWDSNRRVYLVTNTVPLTGDYNHDRVVDAADYTVWRDSLGDEGYHLNADGDGDGDVDEDDYFVWRDNFGEVWAIAGSGAGAGSAAIPEPSSLVLLMTAVLALWATRLRRMH